MEHTSVEFHFNFNNPVLKYSDNKKQKVVNKSRYKKNYLSSFYIITYIKQ